MEGREFSEKIRRLQDQVAELQRASSQDEREQLETVLRNTLEELHVADEEMRQQNEALMAVRQALETERQHYLDLFDFAPDGYLETDFEGVIQEANYAAAVLFNVRKEFLVGKPLIVFLSQEARSAFYAQLRGLSRGERVRDWEVCLQSRQGTPFHVAISAIAVRGPEGRPAGLRWLVRDVDEQVRQREQETFIVRQQETFLARQQGALLQINQVVQEMMRAADLEKVARVCYEQLQGLGLDFDALAIHRLIEEETRTFETYEVQPSKEAARWVKPHPHVYEMWQGGRTVYRRDVEVDPEGLRPERLETLNQRYGAHIRCILDVPHIHGTIALLSTHPDAFSEPEVSFIELISRVVSLGVSRVEDLERVEVSQRQLRSLASDLVSVQEEERRRLAMDLHDRIGQTLAISKMMLGALRAQASSADLAEPLDNVYKLIDQTIQDTRSLTFELSPPVLYELGLEAALDWLVEQVQKRHALQVTFEDDGERKQLEDDVRNLLFRAVQELLVNVVKHAQAQSARVAARREGEEIHVEVEDDGVGVEASRKDLRPDLNGGFGLFNIRERLAHVGGHFQIHSEPGKGTRVVLGAPLRRE